MSDEQKPPAPARANRKVCFMAGAGHSGSTLLGLILGSHEACFYAGEGNKSRLLGDPSAPRRKRECKICGAGCPVWSGLVVGEGADLYEMLSRRTGRPIVVDSTKSSSWISARAAEVEAAGAETFLVLLLRDGRAVVSSRLRKSPAADPAQVITGWVEKLREARSLYETWPRGKRVVRYEVLATDPRATAARLCADLGLAFDESMLAFDRHEHHPLGGNSGTQHQVSRRQRPAGDGPTAEPPERSRGFYARRDGVIDLDVRWLEELRPEHACLFEELAGEANAELRWEGRART